MKLRKKDKDYYLFIEEGEIIEEEKDKDSLKIMNDSSIENNSSTENSRTQNDFYTNLSKYINCLPKKSTFNKILLITISLISVLLAFNIIGILKTVQDDSINNLNTELDNVKITQKDKEQVLFISTVISNSNTNIKGYYDVLRDLIQYNSGDTYYYNKCIADIQSKASKDLNDLYTLNEYIDIELFSKPISILESRFSNIVKLCEILLNNNKSSNINEYNNYANNEIDLGKQQIDNLSNYFKKLNIKYEINDSHSLVYRN